MFRLFKRCPHEHIRCIHGDERNQTQKGFFHIKIASARCVKCGKVMYGTPRPYICTETGQAHQTWGGHEY